jgi:DNA repair protein RadC
MSPRASKKNSAKDAGTYPPVVGSHAQRATRERTRAVRLTTLRLVRESSFLVTIEVSASSASPAERVPIRSPRDVYQLMAPYAEREVGESFWILPLDAQHRLIGAGPTVITRGILNASLVHPREVFLAAIIAGAAAVVLVHNHPSGAPDPSPDDRAVTEQLVAAGQLLDIPVHDHVIVGRGRFVSFAEGGLL